MKKGLLVINEFIRNRKERFISLYDDLEKAFNDNGLLLDRISNRDLMININEKKDNYDFVLFWDKDINLAYHLENIGYQLFNNAKAIEICDDKIKTALALENTVIKMPKTIVCPFTFSNNPFNISDLSFLDEVISSLNLPLVVKEANGSFGEEVYLVKTKEELVSLVLKLTPKPILFQEFITSSSGRDVRIEVIGGKAVGAVLRESESGDFRSNVLQGGKMKKVDIDARFLEMAETVSKTIGLDFGGIDIMFGSNNEPIFCEANSNVHFRTFRDVTGTNLADLIAKYIKNKTI